MSKKKLTRKQRRAGKKPPLKVINGGKTKRVVTRKMMPEDVRKDWVVSYKCNVFNGDRKVERLTNDAADNLTWGIYTISPNHGSGPETAETFGMKEIQWEDIESPEMIETREARIEWRDSFLSFPKEHWVLPYRWKTGVEVFMKEGEVDLKRIQEETLTLLYTLITQDFRDALFANPLMGQKPTNTDVNYFPVWMAPYDNHVLGVYLGFLEEEGGYKYHLYATDQNVRVFPTSSSFKEHVRNSGGIYKEGKVGGKVITRLFQDCIKSAHEAELTFPPGPWFQKGSPVVVAMDFELKKPSKTDGTVNGGV